MKIPLWIWNPWKRGYFWCRVLGHKSPFPDYNMPYIETYTCRRCGCTVMNFEYDKPPKFIIKSRG